MADQRDKAVDVPMILPRGRHQLDPAVVKESQVARMIDAMTALCAEDGFANVSVADVLKRSGVSRKTFYEHFSNKEECLLAAYDAGVAVLGARIAAAVNEAEREGRSVLRETVSAYIDALADSPEFAKLFSVEMLAGGPIARKRRDEGFEMFIVLYRSLTEQAADEGVEEPSEDQIVAAIGAVAELIRRTVSTQGAEALPAIKPLAIDLTWTLLFGLSEAPD